MLWGKHRTKFGEWMDEQEEYNQNEFAKESGVNKDTVTKACSDDDWIPSAIVMRKIMKVVKEVSPDKKASDFWDI